ncbi:MAG: aminoglycoside adenylyltransferase domain-containing protein [Chloroflexota bacterium]
MQKSVTPYPDVNATLLALHDEAQAILGERFVGLYLYGSLSSGDFNPQSSDIDFVAVTGDYLPNEAIAALEAMHTRLWASDLKWAAKLEGCYLPRQCLRRYNPDDGPFPAVNEGKFYVARHGSDWVIQRHILRQHGVAVAGPDIRPWIDPVSPDDLRRAVSGILEAWWRPIVADPAFLQRRDYQAFTVLTMCRAMYALQCSEIVSKPVAARWAQMEFSQWSGLIDRALAWPLAQQIDEIDETLGFLRFALAYADKGCVKRDA